MLTNEHENSSISRPCTGCQPHATAEEITSAYLLDDLGEQTSIATRTRLHVDYAPGTINILHGENLTTQGARTVWEALAMVPGFDLSIDETGTRHVLVRGVGATYSSGNIKILLNDVALNSELMSLANPVFNLPMEQVERIEVIRGPGSAIYGESAYMGVVNVITRKQGQRLFAGIGSNRALAGGGVMSFVNEETGLGFNLNLAGWNADGSSARTGHDSLYATGDGVYSYAPGPANNKMESRSALINLSLDKFSLSAQWLEDGAGDHYGINYILPPDEKRIVTRQRHRALELRQGLELSPALQAEFKLGWQDFSHNRDHLYVYPGLLYWAPPSSEPLWLSRDYLERRYTAGADLAWEQGRNTVLLGWSFNHVEIASASWDTNFGGHAQNWIDTGMKRIVSSLTLQDEFRPSGALTLTAGVRHDRYSDLGNSTTPRLAAVWQLSPGHTIKAQYAEAFRAPTFYETYYGSYAPYDNHLRPETVATRELGYLFRGQKGNGGITLFHSELKDMIVWDWVRGYYNHSQAHTQGVELEWEQWLSAKLKFTGNLTYLDTLEHATDKSIPGSTHWLANAGLEYAASQDLTLAIQLRHSGDKARESADSRSSLGGHQVADLSARLFNVAGNKGLTLRAGIKNLFDRDVRIAAPADTYPNDYPVMDRQWWSTLTYSF